MENRYLSGNQLVYIPECIGNISSLYYYRYFINILFYYLLLYYFILVITIKSISKVISLIALLSLTVQYGRAAIGEEHAFNQNNIIAQHSQIKQSAASMMVPVSGITTKMPAFINM